MMIWGLEQRNGSSPNAPAPRVTIRRMYPLLKSVSVHRFVYVLCKLLNANWDLKRDCSRGFPKANEVFMETEYLSTVDPHPLEDAIAVKKAMVINADLRIIFGEVLAVYVDLLIHQIVRSRENV